MRLAILLSALLATACSKPAPVAPDVEAVLEAPDRFEILALSPEREQDTPSGPPAGTFHGHRILGRAQLPAAGMREELVGLVYQGLRDSDGTVARCFNPRHGISATRGGRTVDLLICYECYLMRIHGPSGEPTMVPTSDKVEPEVTRRFREAGVVTRPRE